MELLAKIQQLSGEEQAQFMALMAKMNQPQEKPSEKAEEKPVEKTDEKRAEKAEDKPVIETVAIKNEAKEPMARAKEPVDAAEAPSGAEHKAIIADFSSTVIEVEKKLAATVGKAMEIDFEKKESAIEKKGHIVEKQGEPTIEKLPVETPVVEVQPSKDALPPWRRPKTSVTEMTVEEPLCIDLKPLPTVKSVDDVSTDVATELSDSNEEKNIALNNKRVRDAIRTPSEQTPFESKRRAMFNSQAKMPDIVLEVLAEVEAMGPIPQTASMELPPMEKSTDLPTLLSIEEDSDHKKDDSKAEGKQAGKKIETLAGKTNEDAVVQDMIMKIASIQIADKKEVPTVECEIIKPYSVANPDMNGAVETKGSNDTTQIEIDVNENAEGNKIDTKKKENEVKEASKDCETPDADVKSDAKKGVPASTNLNADASMIRANSSFAVSISDSSSSSRSSSISSMLSSSSSEELISSKKDVASKNPPCAPSKNAPATNILSKNVPTKYASTKNAPSKKNAQKSAPSIYIPPKYIASKKLAPEDTVSKKDVKLAQQREDKRAQQPDMKSLQQSDLKPPQQREQPSLPRGKRKSISPEPKISAFDSTADAVMIEQNKDGFRRDSSPILRRLDSAAMQEKTQESQHPKLEQPVVKPVQSKIKSQLPTVESKSESQQSNIASEGARSESSENLDEAKMESQESTVERKPSTIVEENEIDFAESQNEERVVATLSTLPAEILKARDQTIVNEKNDANGLKAKISSNDETIVNEDQGGLKEETIVNDRKEKGKDAEAEEDVRMEAEDENVIMDSERSDSDSESSQSGGSKSSAMEVAKNDDMEIEKNGDEEGVNMELKKNSQKHQISRTNKIVNPLALQPSAHWRDRDHRSSRRRPGVSADPLRDDLRDGGDRYNNRRYDDRAGDHRDDARYDNRRYDDRRDARRYDDRHDSRYDKRSYSHDRNDRDTRHRQRWSNKVRNDSRDVRRIGSPDRKGTQQHLKTVSNDFPCVLCPTFVTSGICTTPNCPHLHFKTPREAEIIGYEVKGMVIMGWANQNNRDCHNRKPDNYPDHRRQSKNQRRQQQNHNLIINQRGQQRDSSGPRWYIICADFQSGKCVREKCKFVHIKKAEARCDGFELRGDKEQYICLPADSNYIHAGLSFYKYPLRNRKQAERENNETRRDESTDVFQDALGWLNELIGGEEDDDDNNTPNTRGGADTKNGATTDSSSNSNSNSDAHVVEKIIDFSHPEVTNRMATRTLHELSQAGTLGIAFEQDITDENGNVTKVTPLVVSYIEPNCESVGWCLKDKVYAMNGTTLNSMEDLSQCWVANAALPNERVFPIVFKVIRDWEDRFLTERMVHVKGNGHDKNNGGKKSSKGSGKEGGRGKDSRKGQSKDSRKGQYNDGKGEKHNDGKSQYNDGKGEQKVVSVNAPQLLLRLFVNAPLLQPPLHEPPMCIPREYLSCLSRTFYITLISFLVGVKKGPVPSVQHTPVWKPEQAAGDGKTESAARRDGTDQSKEVPLVVFEPSNSIHRCNGPFSTNWKLFVLEYVQTHGKKELLKMVEPSWFDTEVLIDFLLTLADGRHDKLEDVLRCFTWDWNKE